MHDWQQVNHYLDQALDLPEQAIDSWLQGIAAAQPDLAVTIAGLLAARKAADFSRFLDGHPAAAWLDAEPTSREGSSIGPYIVETELGRGGMGSVWRARRADGRYQGHVAIKYLRAAWLGRDGEARFRREGSLLARLDHSNIARLLDAGVTQTGEPYLVLEYVEGLPIDRYCDSHQLSIAARLQLFLEVLSAVEHAHRNLIVHRDIKPANIMVTDGGKVKLLDFGISRLVDEQDTSLTRSGMVIMTPEYAAPEQLLKTPITTATDVYLLGLLLHVLLTGRPAFTPTGKSAAELLHQVTEEDLPLPSVAVTSRKPANDDADIIAQARSLSVESLRRTLQGDLDNILIKALRKEPIERYASAAAFAADLQRFLRVEPVLARPKGPGYRLGKFVRRNRAAVLASTLVALGAISAAALLSQQSSEARRQRDQAQYQSRRAASVSEFLDLFLLSDGGPNRPALSAAQRIELGVQMLQKQYADEPGFAGRMMVQLAARLTGDDTRRAMRVYAQAYQLGRRTGDAELMVKAQCNAAYTQSNANLQEGVLDRLQDAQRLLAQLADPSADLQVACLMGEAHFENVRGNAAAAIPLLRKAMALTAADGGERSTQYASIASSLGVMYAEQNDPRAALEMLQLSIDLDERYGRSGTWSYFINLKNFGTTLSIAGEIRAALARRELLMQRAREFEPAGEEGLTNATNQAGLLMRMAQPEAALSALSGTLATARASGNPAALIRVLNFLAGANIGIGRLPEASLLLDEAVTLAEGPAGSNPIRSRVEKTRAELALARNDAASARQHIAPALTLSGYRSGGPPVRLLGSLLTLAAKIALRDEQPRDAEQFARDALALVEPAARGPDTSADVGDALLQLAKVRVASGAASDAPALLERAVRCLVNGLGEDHPLTREARNLAVQIASSGAGGGRSG